MHHQNTYRLVKHLHDKYGYDLINVDEINDSTNFDEYIYTGTILRNFNFYAKLICKNANFKIGAYAIFVDNINNFEQIQFSLYSKSTIMEGYTKGVYPYEDRIDKIGYFYHITDRLCEYFEQTAVYPRLQCDNS